MLKMSGFVGAWFISSVISLGLLAGVVFVAVHFIRKFW